MIFASSHISHFNDLCVCVCVRYNHDVEQNLNSLTMHLANFSVNKKSSTYESVSQCLTGCTGSKWSIKALFHFLSNIGLDVPQIEARIHDLIIKTLLSAEEDVTRRLNAVRSSNSCCVELFGFDVLLDSSLKPWLIEVNVYPSLSSSSYLDKAIK